MARTSRIPCRVPSSPGRPCKTLSATSGLTVASPAAISRPTSMRVTREPSRESASPQVLPERSDISRSADQPPIRTATCLLIRSGPSRSLARFDCHADALDLPLEADARVLPHPHAYRLAQVLDVGCACAAEVNQKIAVQLRDLSITKPEPAASRGIDELPRLATRR